MLFWAKWKARIIWLLSWPIAVWAAMSNFVQQRPLLAVMAVLLAFAGTTQSYRHRFEIQHFFENGRDGSIIVNSPTVYTRQRLVNDRLDQARWLRTQLEFTEEKREAEFKSIDAVRQVSTTTKGTLNIPRGDSSNSENAAKNSPNDPNKSNQSIEIMPRRWRCSTQKML